MKLIDLFLKDINRPIETVIKADDREHIFTEVDEYVITKEIEKKISHFFTDYNEYGGANGVWISGFFGSGKSHLLKILSYVLENKEHEGRLLGEIFASKIEGDAMLKGDIQRATTIPSESILFNIDQQAQITSKSDEDAILNVFYKVFNDHLGYFGTQRHIAEFERWLDNEGVYSDFKKLYQTFAQEDWRKGRRKYFSPKTKNAVAKALAEINSGNAEDYKGIMDTLRKDNRISVEDFCEKVAHYIEQKEQGFRLNFFIDEVGQYISENIKLMLNLQTIAETLASKCKGKSWVFVTAQEDLNLLVGDDSAVQSDDFSKIQGRFKLRISLTSANVDEVIEKRLLAKKEAASQMLSKNWEAQHANLNTLLSFSESGVQFRKYQGEKDFVHKFPFIPYQFDLFQQCIKELSKHNAFQGKHASVGERSMLGVFQEVLKNMGGKDTNTLVSFDKMFEGLRATIRGEIQNAITLAENNLLDNPMAIKILKVLFLVKYYSNFKTSSRNVSVLMLPSIHLDLKQHEKEVQVALNLLENQTYIQRNGDDYEFLTDDEKDVENEIKATEIDTQQITQFFNQGLFDSVIGDNRLRFLDNKQDYEFTKRIDGAIVGREKELAIEILTPNSDYYGREEFYKAHTMGYNTLVLFVLPQTDRLIQDIRLFLKTEKYHKQNYTSTTKHSLKLILAERQKQNVIRKRQLTLQLKRLLGESTVYLNGTKQNIKQLADGKAKVIHAFQNLVKLAYPSLKMLGTVQYTEDMVKNVLLSKKDDLFAGDDLTMSEAESEIYNFIIRRKKRSERTSLADLKEHFSKKPYGWYINATLYMLGRLYKRGKVEARQNATLLSDADFLANLLNSRTFGNTLLEPQADFDQHQVKKLKEVYQALFDEKCPYREARDIANQFKEKADKEAHELLQLTRNQTQYPFLQSLEPLVKYLQQISKMDYGVLIQKIKDYEDDLLDAKEDLLDPIRKFWNGEQKKIFDKVIQFLNGDQSNMEYIETDEIQKLKDIQNHPKPYKGNTIKEAKETMDSLRKKVLDKIEAERAAKLSLIEEKKKQVQEREDFKQLEAEKQQKITASFEQKKKEVKGQRYIASLQQYTNKVEDLVTDKLNEIQKLKATAEEPAVQYIKKSKVVISFNKSELATEKEVEEYTDKLKTEMLRHIRENRRIVL